MSKAPDHESIEDLKAKLCAYSQEDQKLWQARWEAHLAFDKAHSAWIENRNKLSFCEQKLKEIEP